MPASLCAAFRWRPARRAEAANAARRKCGEPRAEGPPALEAAFPRQRKGSLQSDDPRAGGLHLGQRARAGSGFDGARPVAD